MFGVEPIVDHRFILDIAILSIQYTSRFDHSLQLEMHLVLNVLLGVPERRCIDELWIAVILIHDMEHDVIKNLIGNSS